MKVIVTGHKKLDHYGKVEATLDKLLAKLDRKKLVLVMAMGDGAAHWVDLYSFQRMITRQVHHPKRREVGKKLALDPAECHDAMVEEADALVAIGEDEANRPLIAKARKKGLKVKVVEVGK